MVDKYKRIVVLDRAGHLYYRAVRILMKVFRIDKMILYLKLFIVFFLTWRVASK